VIRSVTPSKKKICVNLWNLWIHLRALSVELKSALRRWLTFAFPAGHDYPQ